MSRKKIKTYQTREEAEANCGPKETVFFVKDAAVKNRVAYVPARTHPLARAAAALAWGMTASNVSGPRKPADVDDVGAAILNMTPDEQAKIAELVARLRKAK